MPTIPPRISPDPFGISKIVDRASGLAAKLGPIVRRARNELACRTMVVFVIGLFPQRVSEAPLVYGSTTQGGSMTKPGVISWLAVVAGLCGCAPPNAPTAPATATTKEEAAAARQRHDYVTAGRLYRSLAERGDASSQHFLGRMYENGEGVPRDFVEAAKWYRLAADQGHTGAQFYLGSLYASGDGVPQDYVQAYMWLDLSSAGQQNFFAAGKISEMAAKMTPAQITEAKMLVSAWRPKKSDRR